MYSSFVTKSNKTRLCDFGKMVKYVYPLTFNELVQKDIVQIESVAYLYFLLLLDFIYRGSLFSILTTLIFDKVLINNKTEQDTEQDKQTNILVEQFTYILTPYI